MREETTAKNLGRKVKRLLIVMLSLTMIVGLFPSLNTLWSADAKAKEETQTLLGAYSYTPNLESGRYVVGSSGTDVVCYDQGLVIPSGAIVYIEIPEGKTMICSGTNACYTPRTNIFWDNSVITESTPGIEVQEGAVLHITGAGTLIATGGDGCAAGDGATPTDVFVYSWSGITDFIKDKDAEISLAGGTAGEGGHGAYAPSPAIGGKGGAGGKGTGSQGGIGDTTNNRNLQGKPTTEGGRAASNGASMGTVYVEGSVTITAKAGGGDYETCGKGEKYENSTRYADYTYWSSWYPNAENKRIYGLVTVGGPGGGGGGANASADIGGGGGGGGGGGAGLSGSYFTSNPTNGKKFDLDTSWSNATDGTAEKGGNGGLSYRVKFDDDWKSLEPGNGAPEGANGLGGTLYISKDATINGHTNLSLEQSHLGTATNTSAGQAAEVKPLTRMEITVELDDAAYTDRIVSLHAQGKDTIELTESSNGMYFGYVPTGADNLFDIYVDEADTGYDISATNTETVTKTLYYYTCEVDVTLDDASYGSEGDHKVTLMKETKVCAELTEESVGKFVAIMLKDVAGNDTYDIYVDGASYGKTLTVKKGERVEAPFYTLTVNTQIREGSSTDPYPGRIVSLYKGEQYITLMAEDTSGTYKAIVIGEDENNKAISYRVRVGDDYCASQITAVNGAAKTVDYFNAAVTLKDGASNWSGQKVTLTGGGRVCNMTEAGTSGVYKVALFGEDKIEYTANVNGVPSKGKIQITDEDKRAATVKFFTANVSLTKDGEPWTEGASVLLKKDGKTAYTLTVSGDSFTKKGIAEGEYDIYVYGANSDADTGVTVSSDTPLTIDYHTITFYKNVKGKTGGDKVQIYQHDTVPAIASAAYEPGYTFLSWKVGTATDSADYIPESITDKTSVYASWVSPKVTLGSFVRCDSSGTTNSTGSYFKFPNVAIQGYPTDKACIGTISIKLENVKLITVTSPSNWTNKGSWDETSGNGSYIFQADSSNNNITVAQAQQYLRSLVFERNSESGTCSVQVSIFGDTN